MAKIVDVPIGKIRGDENALRAAGEDEGLEDLAASIRRIGLLQPLTVYRDGDDYVIIAGHRRFAACQALGSHSVSCLVREKLAAEVAEVALAENLFRADLTPIETSAAMNDIVDQGTMSIEELARAMHRSQHWVARMVAMLQWPDDVLAGVQAGAFSVSAAASIALITDDVYREFLVKQASENGVTARVTAAWLQAWRSMAPVEQAAAVEPLPSGERTLPAVPQAPCICCSDVFRTDELSHVPVCSRCVRVLRDSGAGER